MIKIENGTYQKVSEESTGEIWNGDRYEFELKVTVPKEDALSSVEELMLHVEFDAEKGEGEIHRYHFYNGKTKAAYNDGFKEGEERIVSDYCFEKIFGQKGYRSLKTRIMHLSNLELQQCAVELKKWRTTEILEEGVVMRMLKDDCYTDNHDEINLRTIQKGILHEIADRFSKLPLS